MSIVVVRHGERADSVDPPPESSSAATTWVPGDPPLTERGKDAARRLGAESRIGELAQAADSVHVFASPFLRTVETAVSIIRGIRSRVPELKHFTFDLDNRLCEIYGPIRIKQGEPPFSSGTECFTAERCQSTELQDDPDARKWIAGHSRGQLPRWGEGADGAASRFRSAFRQYCSLVEKGLMNGVNGDTTLREQRNPLVILVTHGDALNNIVGDIHRRTVFDAAFLSFIVTQKRPFRSPTMKREAATGRDPVPVSKLPRKWCVVFEEGLQSMTEGDDDDDVLELPDSEHDVNHQGNQMSNGGGSSAPVPHTIGESAHCAPAAAAVVQRETVVRRIEPTTKEVEWDPAPTQPPGGRGHSNDEVVVLSTLPPPPVSGVAPNGGMLRQRSSPLFPNAPSEAHGPFQHAATSPGPCAGSTSSRTPAARLASFAFGMLPAVCYGLSWTGLTRCADAWPVLLAYTATGLVVQAMPIARGLLLLCPSADRRNNRRSRPTSPTSDDLDDKDASAPLIVTTADVCPPMNEPEHHSAWFFVLVSILRVMCSHIVTALLFAFIHRDMLQCVWQRTWYILVATMVLFVLCDAAVAVLRMRRTRGYEPVHAMQVVS